jgi:RNA polymerase sigma factor (sigma-70 family)
LRDEGTAWETLVRRYQRLVFAIVRRAGLDEHAAADVFQTVFARLIEHLPRLRQPERLQAWIVTTAKRESIAQSAKGRRTVSLTPTDDEDGARAVDEVADDSPLPEEALIELQQVNQVRLTLERLDSRCRELLLLLFRDEDDAVPYDEVARRMAMPVGSIGPTRSRCIEKLRALAG